MRQNAQFVLSMCLLIGALSAQGVVNLPARDQEKTEKPRALENSDVIAMLNADLSAEVVKAKIVSSVCQFDTSPEALAALKKAGADDQVILAMLEKETPSYTAPAAPAVVGGVPDSQVDHSIETARSAAESSERQDGSEAEKSVADTRGHESRSGSATPRRLTRNSRLYIAPMHEDLDGYIRAEIIKKKVPLQVVMAEEDAEFIMIGSATEEERRKWHEGWLTAERDKTSGNVSIIDVETGSLVWAGEAGDRSLWFSGLKRGGHRKVADRIVNQLKKAVK